MAKPARTARPRSAQGTTSETAVPDSTSDPGLVVLTMGHSTRSIETFIELLRAQGVQRLVDVRTIPRSKRNPQFNRDILPKTLHGAGVHYTHLGALGGLRHPAKDSVNLGWRNASFRGFADYMQTPEFEAGLGELMGLAREEQVAIMCAEAVPWRCHRSLIADALVVRGIGVCHLMSLTRAEPHHLTPFARVEDQRITYPLELFSSEAAPSKY
jgi:uncharacterized protein (DUF488 family)